MQDLFDRFLSGRAEQTARAYRMDVEDLGRFIGVPATAAVARLLSGGPAAAHHLTLEYVLDLMERGRAPATIERRLKTLHALASMARSLDLVGWALEVPSEREVADAFQERTSRASYIVQRHPSEVNRLDLQHYAVKEAVGHDYLAPVDEPERVLDVGAGTGQWGFDVSEAFPDALIVGIDLVASKRNGPPGYRCVRGNILRGLPFQSGQFDLIHQRFLVAGIPLLAWPDVVSEMARVARPGAWIELAEPLLALRNPGPATTRVLSTMLDMIASPMGLDTTDAVYHSLDAYLRDAGLLGVTRRELLLPIGEWGGRVGSFMASDLRAGFTRVCEVLQARSHFSAAEGHQLVEDSLRECEENRTEFPLVIAYGRKPVG